MTEKRFDVGNLKIQDNAPKGRLYLLDMQGGVNSLCSLINGLNDKLNRLEKENEQLKLELDTHKHPLWSTREAEQKINELTNLLSNETKKNAILLEEINSLRIENMRLKKVKE